MYCWISIGTSADFQKIADMLPADFGPARVVERLRKDISAAVRGVLVEEAYIDKDYRSTYYNYYAKKGRTYQSDCVRLHFFDAEVKFDVDSLSLSSADDRIEDHYFGFMVLRPTLVATIGRTVLSPDVRLGASGYALVSKHRVHVLGHKLHVWGFPSMDQHVDISVCAHVACWAILRHYSERFGQQRELLVHDITLLANQFDPGGLVPSLGLQLAEAERIFQAAGTFPVVVAKLPSDSAAFYRQLLVYLESGFPLFIAMHGRNHAVAVVGHGWASAPNPSTGAVEFAWDKLANLLVVDDNQLPYLSIPVAPDGVAKYSAQDFDCFIVALPEKIFYPADAVERSATELFRLLQSEMSLPAESDLVLRYFVTTVSSLREYVRLNRSATGDILVQAVMRQRMAQFVWVVEFASAHQWARGQVAARAVLDATASVGDPNPFWFAHNFETAIFFDRSANSGVPQVVPLSPTSGATELTRMERNLRPVRPK